jgi:hypothetical protein
MASDSTVRRAPNDETMDAIRVRYEVLDRIIKNPQYDGKAIKSEAWEAFQEIRHLRRAIATMVHDVDDLGVVTTHGGDRFAFLTDSTEAIRRALLSVAPEAGAEGERT